MEVITESVEISGNSTNVQYDYDLDLSFSIFNYYDLIPTAIVYGQFSLQCDKYF